MGMSSEYNIQSSRGYSVITFDSSLSDCKWGDIERIGVELRTALSSQNRPHWLIDLTPLEFMGSSIVALLVRIWKSLQEREGGMVVVNPNSMNKEVLEIAGLNKVWTICDTRDEGEQVIKKLVPNEGPKATAVFAALLGWVVAGCAVAILLGSQNGVLGLTAEAVQASSYACGGIAALCGLVTALTGKQSWRAIGVVLLVTAGGLIATIASRGV